MCTGIYDRPDIYVEMRVITHLALRTLLVEWGVRIPPPPGNVGPGSPFDLIYFARPVLQWEITPFCNWKSQGNY